MANIIVSGAGSSEVNGIYVESGTINDKPSYVYGDYGIFWSGGVWQIIYYGGFPTFYYSSDDVATPDLCTTWEVNEGEPPVPTVTKEVTGNPKHFLYYARMRGNQ